MPLENVPHKVLTLSCFGPQPAAAVHVTAATAAAAAITTYVSQLSRAERAIVPAPPPPHTHTHTAASKPEHLTSLQVCAPFEGPVLRAAEVALSPTARAHMNLI